MDAEFYWNIANNPGFNLRKAFFKVDSSAQAAYTPEGAHLVVF